MTTPRRVDVIGRETEVAALEAFVDSGATVPAVLILDGEPGIGKTTLWQLGVDAARARSLRVLEASPAEAESALSFAALGDLVESDLGQVLRGLPGPQRRALEVALLLRADQGVPPDQRAVGMAFLNAVRALAASQRVLLAVDDLQWLDPSSAAVLAFTIRRLQTEPVLLLLAQRSEGDGSTAVGLEPALAGHSVHRLTIGPLSLGALHWLLSDRLDAPFSRPVLRRLHEVSGGNPFFALELARALVRHARDLEPGQPLPMPDQLAALVGERLGGLPHATQEALTVAAALSKPTVRLITAAMDADAQEGLGPAIEAHVVEIAGGRVRFTHPLLASAAYERASPVRRRQLHRTLARLVDDVEERAHHLALTTNAPDEGIAAALEEAAGRASSRGAQDAAADLSAQARLLTPAQAVDAIRRRSLREAEYALQSGDTPRARALLDALLAATSPGPARAEVLTNLARVHFNGLDWRASVGLLEQALQEAGDDPSLRAQIELHLAINLDLLRRNVVETLEHARAAVALAEHLADDAMLAEAIVLQAKSELLLGRGWPTRLVERVRTLEPATRSLPADRWANDYLASMRGWTDDLEGAIEALERVEETAHEQGDEVSLTWALARVAELKCYAGRWEEASRDIERGSEIALQAGQRANEAIFLGLTALVEAYRGSPASARAAGDRALKLAEPAGAAMARRTALAALGLLELSLGRPGEADAHLAPLTMETRAARVGEPGAMRFLPDAIEALIGLGHLDTAAELLDFLEERARATGRISALAAAGRCRGLLLSAHGDSARGRSTLARAFTEHESVQMPFERARTLLVLGEAQRRTKQKRPARESLEEALGVFEELGATLWIEKARAELARIGGRAPSPGALTATELRVAELVCEGRSNKEVASTLFVTAKTVETTLSRIYAKLDIHSRSELAGRLAKARRSNV